MDIATQLTAVAEQITDVNDSVSNIQAAIIEKGVPMDNVPLSQYGNKVREIKTGTSQPKPGQVRVRWWVPTALPNGEYNFQTDFYDRGDYVVFPDAPDLSHKGLVFDSWTHLPSELTNLQHEYEVGALYVPADGNTTVSMRFPGYLLGASTSVALYFTVTGSGAFEVFGDGFTSATFIATGYAILTVPVVPSDGKVDFKIRRVSGTGSFSLGVAGSTLYNGFFITRIAFGNNCTGAANIALVGSSGPDNRTELCDYCLRPGLTAYSQLTNRKIHVLILPRDVRTISAAGIYNSLDLRYLIIPPTVGVDYIGAEIYKRMSSIIMGTGANVVTPFAPGGFYNLQYMIIDLTNPGATPSYSQPHCGFICYVPDEAVAAYKSARGTLWAPYIKGFSEKPYDDLAP